MTRFICANLRVFFWTPMAAAWWSGGVVVVVVVVRERVGGDSSLWWYFLVEQHCQDSDFSFQTQKSAGVPAVCRLARSTLGR